MMYKWLGMLLLVILMAVPACAKSDLPLLVIADSGDMGGRYAVAQSLLLMSLDFHVVNPMESVDVSPFSGIVLLVDPHTPLSEELVSSVTKSELPLFIIGPGGIDSFIDARWVEGCFSVDCTLLNGAEASLLMPQASLCFPLGWDKDLGGSIGLLEGRRSPLCTRTGSITCLSWFDSDSEIMRNVLSDHLAQWLWPYRGRPTRFGSYIVLEEVYPFEDPDLLLRQGDFLFTHGIPFAVEVMPIQKNAEYPAMKRFCETLVYLQSRGAFIAMHVPLNGLQALDLEALREAIRASFEAYVQYGVYPLALSAPSDYLWSEKGLAALRGVKTILLHAGSQTTIADRNLSFADGHLLLAPSELKTKLVTDVYASALYLDVHQNPEALYEQLLSMKGMHIKSLWDIDNILYIGDSVLRNRGRNLAFDGEPKSLAYQPFKYELHNYNRGITQYLTEQIRASNQVLVLLVFLAAGAFLLIVLAARLQMRKQFISVAEDERKDHDR
ncbi:MAG: DUF2334 domain-containing protein [Christensenellales bacterium]